MATCKDCFSYLACKSWMDYQNNDWDYLRDEYPNNKNAHMFCKQFNCIEDVIVLPYNSISRNKIKQLKNELKNSNYKSPELKLKQSENINMSKYYNRHEVATIITNLLNDDCACNLSSNDEWLPMCCDFANTCCPNPGGVACWEQYLKYLDDKDKMLKIANENFKKYMEGKNV